MKKIVKYIHRWRWHRLYRLLFFHYMTKTDYADEAGYQAGNAFTWITGEKWEDHLWH